MADTAIDIGFNVANSDLKDGLDQALQDFAATSAAITQDLASIAQAAKTTGSALVSFQDVAEGKDAPLSTKRKEEENGFADQVSHIQILKTLNEISAADAIQQELNVENAKFERLSADI